MTSLDTLCQQSYLGVDTGVAGLSTAVSPGHNTLQLTIAHHGATRVTLREREKERKRDRERERQRERERGRERCVFSRIPKENYCSSVITLNNNIFQK